MPNTIITPSIIARTAVRVLDNELNAASNVYRDYEAEYNKNVNGYKIGSTLSIRKPAQFVVQNGPVISAYQDAIEGTVAITVNRQRTIPMMFSSQELTMNVSDFAEKYIKPAMVQFANELDRACLAQYTKMWNWVGTPGSTVNGYASFGRVAQRMSEMAVPSDNRFAFLSPADFQGAVTNLTGLYIQNAANTAYREGELGKVSGLRTFEAQNVQTLVTGTRTNGTVNGASQNVTYSGAQANSWTQNFNVTGIGTTNTVAAGEVFTIAGVFAVNPVTKAVLPYLQQFTVTTAATATATAATLTISPAIISSGAFQTVSATPATGAAVTWVGTASTAYPMNVAFHKNAIGLVVVPMEKPPGAVDTARDTYKGLSVRVQPFYDGTNDNSAYRLDILYGIEVIDPRLGVRFSQ